MTTSDGTFNSMLLYGFPHTASFQRIDFFRLLTLCYDLPNDLFFNLSLNAMCARMWCNVRCTTRLSYNRSIHTVDDLKAERTEVTHMYTKIGACKALMSSHRDTVSLFIFSLRVHFFRFLHKKRDKKERDTIFFKYYCILTFGAFVGSSAWAQLNPSMQ